MNADNQMALSSEEDGASVDSTIQGRRPVKFQRSSATSAVKKYHQ